MMTTPDLHAMVDQYLQQRRSLGYAMTGYELKLHAFADYVLRGNRWPLTARLALEWATLVRTAASSYHSKRLCYVRQFARYCANIEPRTEIPPTGLLGRGPRRPKPHIYSDAEIGRLLAATRSLQPRDGIRPASYRLLFGLLVSTGIRIGEALRCEEQDVDLRAGNLTVRKSKGVEARVVPLHPTAIKQLRDYLERRPAYLADPFEKRLLIGETGGPLEHAAVQGTFDRLRQRTGLAGGNRKQPRIHDFRHTFACRRLVAWQREGVDINQAIFRLSTYLGHVQPTDTYWYISVVPELLDNGCQRFEKFVQGEGVER